MNQSQPVPTPTFRRVSKGERPSASEYNRLVDTLEKLCRVVANMPQTQRQPLVFGEIGGNKDVYRNQANANTIDELYFDTGVAAGSDNWKDRGLDHSYVVDPQGAPQLDGERHAFMHLRHANVFIPLPGVRWHLAVLDGDLTRTGTATASVYQVSGSTEADSTFNVTVYGWFLDAGETLESGARCAVVQHLQSRRWYALPFASAAATASSCLAMIGGYALDDIPGYDATEKQALIHDHGCLEWLTIRSCDSGSA